VVTREPTPTMNIRGLLILTVALPGNATEGTHRVGPKDIYMACKTGGGIIVGRAMVYGCCFTVSKNCD
jgi:hypothetical protein